MRFSHIFSYSRILDVGPHVRYGIIPRMKISTISLYTVIFIAIACRVFAIDIASDSLSVTLDEQNKGAVMRIVSSKGLELGAIGTKTPLFRIEACRTDNFTNSVFVKSSNADSFAAEKTNDGARLVYGFDSGPIAQVVCTVRTKVGDDKLRWRIKTSARDGWAVVETSYPVLPLSIRLGGSSEDDAFVIGMAKGGIIRNPSAKRIGWGNYGRQPGNLVAQFACLYDDRGGFYLAAEDAQGHAKRIGVERLSNALAMQVRRMGFSKEDDQPYDVAIAAFTSADSSPADWHDAADIYKRWALRQQWCAVPLARRADLPTWMKDAPAMVRFNREWLAQPDNIRAWMKDYWLKTFPSAPLVMAYWGWEKRGNWVTPDYFPVHPSKAAFESLVRDMRKLGGHAFPWPSGYHWTLTYDKKPDGSFVWDDRARFASYAEPHAIRDRDGKMYTRAPFWLRGGNCACLCGGDPWTIRWWNEEVCRPLVDMGCEMIQVDQVVGGAFPPCWNRNHPHAPGEGPWKTDCFREQLVSMAAAMKAVEPDSIVCFEEPNEHFNHIIGIQDYRDCELKNEWASVFNYIYHEFVPCFQSNPRRGNRVWQAHEAVDGQIPHLSPSMRDLGHLSNPVENGDFETTRENIGSGFLSWERVTSYNNLKWNGRSFVDRNEKKDGATSLRLETSASETVQVSQNIIVDDYKAFRPGAKYRFSAWLKTGKMAQSNSVRLGILAPGLKGLGGTTLQFPKEGTGWNRITGDFDMKPGAEMIRIMIHISGEATAWVDGITLEEVTKDGTVKPIVMTGSSSYSDFMKQWVALYHGEGRDWLAFGRQVKPPRILCAEQQYEMRNIPCVFHAAYESLDGRKALVLANATGNPQGVTVLYKDRFVSLTLAPDEIRLIRE